MLLDMSASRRWWILLGALAAGSGTALAAWHAHGLAARLDPEAHAIFAAGLREQFQAAVGLLVAGLLPGSRSLLRHLTGLLFLAGLLLFSGSLYLRAAWGMDVPPVAPVGGSALILGWLVLGLAAATAAGPGREG